MGKREKPIHESALPLLRRINDGKFTKTQASKKLGVLPQHITNWLGRGIPASRISDVAELCGLSTDEYRQEAGLAPKGHRPHPAGIDSPETIRLIRAFGWLTTAQQKELLSDLESKAAANKTIAKEMGTKWEFATDEEVVASGFTSKKTRGSK